MHKNRIVLAITAAVVIALLFMGIGYAVFTGDARTYNPNDEQTLAYMSVTPADFDPIFTTVDGGTIFDSYVYYNGGILTAYAFNVDAETVTEVTVSETTYKAVQLGTAKNMVVLNNTGAAISKLNIGITANNDVGNASFVYIFKLTIGEVNSYIVFNGSSVSGNVQISPATPIADGGNATIAITVYVGYIPNVYVPDNYIGPASATQYAVAASYEKGVTYYGDNTGAAIAQPADAAAFNTAVEGGTTYYKGYSHPYIQTANAPIDLTTTSFGIEVTDATS